MLDRATEEPEYSLMERGAPMKKIRLLIALALALPATAYADLVIYKVPGPDLSNTIQAQNFVLQVGKDPGDPANTESGCIALDTSGGDITGAAACTAGGGGFVGGDEKSQTQTRIAGDLGITDGNDLRILFDANESGGNSITIEDLRFLLLDPNTGDVIFSADLSPLCTNPVPLAGVTVSASGGCTIDPTVTGNGKNDALLRLDAAQATAFDAAVTLWGGGLANARVGLLANVSGVSGGFEGFYVGNIATLDPPVPEPGTLAIVALGLACTLFARRRFAPTVRWTPAAH
jgi:hypothetical protein